LKTCQGASKKRGLHHLSCHRLTETKPAEELYKTLRDFAV